MLVPLCLCHLKFAGFKPFANEVDKAVKEARPEDEQEVDSS